MNWVTIIYLNVLLYLKSDFEKKYTSGSNKEIILRYNYV